MQTNLKMQQTRLKISRHCAFDKNSANPSTPLVNWVALGLLAASLSLSGCQTMQPSNADAQPAADAANPQIIDFRIMGKIGVTTTLDGKPQSGSAFYAWGQTGERFAIDITGALGIGKTYIEGVPGSARLVSEKTGDISAATPEALLFVATKWRAPISQLPFWIMGKPTLAGTHHEFDGAGRLTASQHEDWQVVLYYPDSTHTLPNKLKMVQMAANSTDDVVENANTNINADDNTSADGGINGGVTTNKVILTITNR